MGGPGFVYKPVALFNTSPRASLAQESLAETIRTMSGRIISEASLSLPLLGQGLDAEGIIARPELASAIQKAIDTLVEVIQSASFEATG